MYATILEYEDLATEDIRSIKTHTFGTTGAIITGGSTERCKKLAKLLEEWEEKGESTIFVYSNKARSTGSTRAYQQIDFNTVVITESEITAKFKECNRSQQIL